MLNTEQNKTKQVVLFLTIIVAIFILYFWKESVFSREDELSSEEHQLYADFVLRNPIVTSYEDADNNGIQDWNDVVNKGVGKDITFSENDQDPRDYNTNLTDVISGDALVISSYLKSGQGDTGNSYDALIDTLIEKSTPIAPDLNVKVKDIYNSTEELEFLKTLDSVYVYLVSSLTSDEATAIILKDTFTTEDKTFISESIKNISSLCQNMNDKNFIIIDKYKEEYKNLLQYCYNMEYFAYSILNRDEDSARAMAGVSVINDTLINMNKDMLSVIEKIPLSISTDNNSGFLLLKK